MIMEIMEGGDLLTFVRLARRDNVSCICVIKHVARLLTMTCIGSTSVDASRVGKNGC